MKMATLGPGLAKTPLSVGACMLEKMCRGTPVVICLSVPMHMCAWLCPMCPYVHGPVCVPVCMGAGHGHLCGHTSVYEECRGEFMNP